MSDIDMPQSSEIRRSSARMFLAWLDKNPSAKVMTIDRPTELDANGIFFDDVLAAMHRTWQSMGGE